MFLWHSTAGYSGPGTVLADCALPLNALGSKFMSAIRINSDDSLKTGSKILAAYGNWDEATRAATLRSDGVYVIKREDLERRLALKAALGDRFSEEHR